jgi:DNA polymerase III subunit delta
MKIAPRQVSGFLADPGRTYAVVLFGDDAGLIRERSDMLVRSVAGSLDDPFRVADLHGDGVDRLADEASGLPMTGGRRVVRLRDATDAATARLKTLLDRSPPGLAVIEAPSLTGRSRLVKLAETASGAAAIGCYAETGAELASTIRMALADEGVRIEPEALAWVAARLGADRAATRREVEKLALFAGRGGTLDVAAVSACVGDASGLSLDDALVAATSGDVAEADRALSLAVAEGATAVGVLRAALGHMDRLARLSAAREAAGASAAEFVRTVRPPIFFRRQPAVTQALSAWTSSACAEAARRLAAAERACKRTGAPADVIARGAIAAIARQAAALRRRGRPGEPGAERS